MGKILINWNIIKVLFVVLIAGFCFFPVYEVNADDCVEIFSWVPNSESDLAGYKIYYGQADGGPYPSVVNIGMPAPVDDRIIGTVTGLDCGQQYYFVCVAVNDVGVESSYSQQANATPSNGLQGFNKNYYLFSNKAYLFNIIETAKPIPTLENNNIGDLN